MMRDPVTALFGFLLVGGLWLVVHLMVKAARQDDMTSPLTRPAYPLRHVRQVRVGTCVDCGKTGVPVQAYADSPLLDPEDHCNGCIRALVDEEVPA